MAPTIHDCENWKILSIDEYGWNRFHLLEETKTDGFEKLAADRGFVCITVENNDFRLFMDLEDAFIGGGSYVNQEVVEGTFENGEPVYNGRISFVIPYCSYQFVDCPGKRDKVRKIIRKTDDPEEVQRWVLELAGIAKKHGLDSITVCMPSYFKESAFALSLDNESRTALDLSEVCSRFIGYRYVHSQATAAKMKAVGCICGSSTYDEKGRELDFFLEPTDEINHLVEEGQTNIS